MKKQELVEFLELESKATKGPWFFEKGKVERGDTRPAILWHADDAGEWIFGDVACLIDAQFIAQSRTIAPLAVRELMEATELLKEFYKNKGATCDSCIDAGYEEICDKCSIVERNRKTKQFLEGYDD